MSIEKFNTDSELRLHIEKLEGEIKELRGAFFYTDFYHGTRIALKNDKKNLLEVVEKFLEKNPDKKAFNAFVYEYAWGDKWRIFRDIVDGDTGIILDNIFKGLKGNEASYWKPVSSSSSYSSSSSLDFYIS